MDNIGNTEKESQTGAREDDGSKMWSLYNSEAEKVDKAMVENWKGDMEGILIFAGLFSAVVTAFIIESYKNLKQDPTDTTVALLVQVSQLLVAISNGTHASIPTSSPDQIPFRAAASAVVVNALWFLSLAFSLACALAATLVQHWARNYLAVIGRSQVPHIRGRLRAYLFGGIESFQMVAIVDIIPVLLHIALFLFLAGLVVFLFPIHAGVASVTLAILIVCSILYTAITILPVIRPHSPYQTHLSTALWRILQVLGLLRDADSRRISGSMADGRVFSATEGDDHAIFSRDLKTVQWTMAMTDNTELEPFVSAIPGFFGGIKSRAEASSALEGLVTDGLVGRIRGLCDSWWSQPQSKSQLALACTRAIEVLADHATLPLWSCMLSDALSMSDCLLRWEKDRNSIIRHYALRVRLSVCFSLLRCLSDDDLLLSPPSEKYLMLQNLEVIRAEVPEAAWLHLPSVDEPWDESRSDIWLSSLSESDRQRTVEVMKRVGVSKLVAGNLRSMESGSKDALDLFGATLILQPFDRDAYKHIIGTITWGYIDRVGLSRAAEWIREFKGGSDKIDSESILVLMHVLRFYGALGGARLRVVHSLVGGLLEGPPMTPEDVKIIRSTLYSVVYNISESIRPTDSSDTEIQQKFVVCLRGAVGPVPSGTTKLPPDIIDALLPIIERFEHLPSVESAISVISDYLKLQPGSRVAKRALQMLQLKRASQRTPHATDDSTNFGEPDGPGIGNSIDDATNDTLEQKAPLGAPNTGSSSNEPDDPASGGSIEGGADVLTEQNPAWTASPVGPPAQDTGHLAGGGSFQDAIHDSPEETSPSIASFAGESLNGVVHRVGSVIEELAPIPDHYLNPLLSPSIMQTVEDPPKELGDVVEGSIRHSGPDLYHSSC